MALQIEVLNDFPRGGIRAALLDFDGTLSLIRQGWQQVMVSFMVEVLLELKTGENPAELEAKVREFVFRLTGKQTVYQMIQLAEEVRTRGGVPLDPLEYKHQYHELLWDLIQHRVHGLENGLYTSGDWLVPGALEFLENLRDRGICLYLASGTDLQYVLKEAELLGLRPFFEERIYGALDEYRRFSKQLIIKRIIDEHRLKGPEFVTFGDGYVEIENTKAVGGIAVGVASEEESRSGIDEWKRARLIASGADVIIPDFRQGDLLASFLLGETEATENQA